MKKLDKEKIDALIRDFDKQMKEVVGQYCINFNECDNQGQLMIYMGVWQYPDGNYYDQNPEDEDDEV